MLSEIMSVLPTMIPDAVQRLNSERSRFEVVVTASLKSLWNVDDLTAIRDVAEFYFQREIHQLPNFGVPDDWGGKNKLYFDWAAMNFFRLSFSEIDELWYTLPRKERERIARMRARENFVVGGASEIRILIDELLTTNRKVAGLLAERPDHFRNKLKGASNL